MEFFILHLQLTEELDGGKHAAVRVGAATTNLQMLNWSNKWEKTIYNSETKVQPMFLQGPVGRFPWT